jgi:hypothetical protein
MPASAQITLRYVGKDVEEGTMAIDDVIVALQGFSGAYSKIATRIDPRAAHQIKVSDIDKKSFSVAVFAWVTSHQTQVAALASTAALAVVKTINGYIEQKKKNKGKDPEVRVDGNGNTVLWGDNNVVVVGDKSMYSLFKDRGLNSEIAKIVSPLKEGGVDKAELSTTDLKTGETSFVDIRASEKHYFDTVEAVATTSNPIRLSGFLVSFNKERNRGTFRMDNGSSVAYHWAGGDVNRFLSAFMAKGQVSIEAMASFDQDLKVVSLAIRSVHPLQGSLSINSE